MASAVLDVGNVVRTGVGLNVLEDADTADIVSTGDEDSGSVVEFEDTINFVGDEIELNRVVFVDVGVGVADRSTVVGHDVWDLVLADALLQNLAELESGFLLADLDCLEAALHVVEDAEVLAGLVDGHDVKEAERETMVSPDSVVNLYVVVLVSADLHRFLSVEGVLQPLTEESGQGEALAELVGTSRRTGSIDTGALVKEPMFGGEHALKMLLRTSCLYRSINLV